MKKRNGAIAEFNKLHWFWKFLLITGTFGVAHAVIRRAKEPRYPEMAGPPEDPSRNQLRYRMPDWLRSQIQPSAPYNSLSSSAYNDQHSWQAQWDRFRH